MTEEQFHNIAWPERFIVRYVDGSSEILLRGEGVSYSPASDDPRGLGFIDATVPKKHPQNQKPIGRVVYFDELLSIEAADGTLLWCNSDQS